MDIKRDKTVNNDRQVMQIITNYYLRGISIMVIAIRPPPPDVLIMIIMAMKLMVISSNI